MVEFDDGQGTDHITQETFTCKGSIGASCARTIQVPVATPNPACNCEGTPDFECCNGIYACVNGYWGCGQNAPKCYDPPPSCAQGDPPAVCTCNHGWQCQGPQCPIIIDVQDTGFQLTNAQGGVRFDLDPAEGPEQLAWTRKGSTNGWLALPHNGMVRTGKDLFGNFTPQPPSDHPNGFLALAVYDEPEKGGNGDGIIDWHDAVYSKLRVWIDENHDGIAQENELYTLPSVGVYSISLSYSETPFTDTWGNQFRYKGKINVAGNPGGDHIDRVIYDVFLKSDGALKPARQSRKDCGNTQPDWNALWQQRLRENILK